MDRASPMTRCVRSTVFVAGSVIAALVVASCGSPHSASHLHSLGHTTVLAYGRLPDGNAFTVEGRQILHEGVTTVELGAMAHERGRTLTGSRVSILTPDSRRPNLSVGVLTGCVGGAPYGVVFGLLHERHDVVLARN